MVAPHGRHDGRRAAWLRGSALAWVAAAVLAAAPTAVANGDPASHFLLVQDVFLPFERRLSDAAKADLVAAVQRAEREGYEVKVAVINTPSDLGTVAALYGSPQEYAEHLGGELGAAFQGHLLIAMPGGLGLSHEGGEPDPDAELVRDLDVPPGADGTARAAIAAVSRLAAAGGDSGGLPLLPVVAVAATVLLAGGVVALVLVARRRPPGEPEAESGPPA